MSRSAGESRAARVPPSDADSGLAPVQLENVQLRAELKRAQEEAWRAQMLLAEVPAALPRRALRRLEDELSRCGLHELEELLGEMSGT